MPVKRQWILFKRKESQQCLTEFEKKSDRINFLRNHSFIMYAKLSEKN